MPRLFYDHSKPFEKKVKFYNTYVPAITVEKPKAYIIPQGWHCVIKRLQTNGVQMKRITRDTTIEVDCYRIDDYKSLPRPYEKHHLNYDCTIKHKDRYHSFFKG